MFNWETLSFNFVFSSLFVNKIAVSWPVPHDPPTSEFADRHKTLGKCLTDSLVKEKTEMFY